MAGTHKNAVSNCVYWQHRNRYGAVFLDTRRTLVMNRGWQLIGGRNNVARFDAVLRSHGIQDSSGNWQLVGWRDGIGHDIDVYDKADWGAMVWLSRVDDGENAPISALLHTDPTLADYRQGDSDSSYVYYDGNQWQDSQYFRVIPSRSVLRKHSHLGYSNTSKAAEFMRLALGMWAHLKGEFAADLPASIVTGNAKLDEWNEAFQWLREYIKDPSPHLHFGGLDVRRILPLLKDDMGEREEIKIAFNRLSRWPEKSFI